MGHSINAVIGSRGTLARLADRFGTPAPTEIDFDLIILPLNEKRLDRIAVSSGEPFDGFTYLTPALAESMATDLEDGRALYIETNYFGGAGGQAAALFENGHLVWQEAKTSKPAKEMPSLLSRLRAAFSPPAKSPINRGLECLGVSATNKRDEFDSIDLARFRSLKSLGL